MTRDEALGIGHGVLSSPALIWDAIADAILAAEKRAAERCAEIAYEQRDGVLGREAIRAEFGLEGK